MAIDEEQERSHLFTVRVWLEELDDGRHEWRGQAAHVMSGETGYFRRWSNLVKFMKHHLPDAGRKRSVPPDKCE